MPDSTTVATRNGVAGRDDQALIDAARDFRETRIKTVDPSEVLVYRTDSGEIRELDLEHRLERPRRKQGTYTTQTLASFVKLVERHDDPGETTIWVDQSGAIVAVLDDNTSYSAARGEHRARLALVTTDEWKHWTSLDGRMVSQEDFAEHIELGLKEIRSPAAADLLEIAQSFYATTSAEMRSAKRLHDGSVKVQYDEEVKASAGTAKGELEIPKEFRLGIAPFLGEQPYEVVARLRYRLNGGDLRLGYKLERPEDIVRDALGQIAGQLGEKFGDRVFMGSPRS